MVTIHPISVSSEWPYPAQSFALHLKRSNHAKSSSELVANDTTLAEPVVPQGEIPDEFEVDRKFLLTTIEGIASVNHHADQALLQPTIMYWYPLIAHAIGSLLSEDIFMTAEVPLVVPLQGTNTRLVTASITACYVTKIPDRFRFRKYKSDQDTDQSLSNALSVHVLGSLEVPKKAAIPIIVVGSDSDIALLVSSVLHQYYLWGIDLPVVGINISKTDKLARLVVGWSELIDQNEDSPIEVHIAFSTKDHADSDVGVFDFSNIDSTLHLINFISDLKSHIIEIREQVHTVSPPIRSLNWRSHESDFWLPKYMDRHSVSILIKEWAAKMKKTYSKFRGEAIGIKDFEDTSGNSSDIWLPRLSPGSCITLEKICPSLRQPIAPDFSIFEVEIIPPDFVTLDSLYGQTSMASMMSERDAILLPLYKFSPDDMSQTASMREIDLRVAAYKEVTKHAWPYQWKTSTDLPVLTERARKLGEDLIKQHNADQNGRQFRQKLEIPILKDHRPDNNSPAIEAGDEDVDSSFSDVDDNSPTIEAGDEDGDGSFSDIDGNSPTIAAGYEDVDGSFSDVDDNSPTIEAGYEDVDGSF
ncbi:hypothetical protein H0H92_008513, partial [Tricholoma furcatifolium]